MADPDLTGLAVTLAGHAEPALLDATRRRFEQAGAEVTVGEGTPEGEGRAPAIAVVFARRPATVPLFEMGDAAFDEEVGRQLLEPRRTAMALARLMAAADGGSVVMVGSVDAFHAYPGRSATAVAMGGLLGFVRAMGVELAARRVRTNLVVAGPLGTDGGEPPAGSDAAAVERTLLRSPSHSFARPGDVAAAIGFVAGPDAAFMTGQTLRVDGGWASLNQAPEGMRFP
jgi:NAD(P)-dependent dehydrogenase (short-subunit alcohol dehydrogenase family)